MENQLWYLPIIPVAKKSNVTESRSSDVNGDEGVGATVSKVCQ